VLGEGVDGAAEQRAAGGAVNTGRSQALAEPVDAASGSTKRLPRPRPSREGRRSADVRDEMRLFNTRGSREHPPTHRATGRVKQIRTKSNSASQESNGRLRGVVGRARADSLADDSSAIFLAVYSDASDPEPLGQTTRACPCNSLLSLLMVAPRRRLFRV
jgi:hypothetical protein